MRITDVLLGATRGVMTSKRGNKNFYKGTGSGKMGRWTTRGRYILEPWRFRQWIVPDLTMCELKPFVSKEANQWVRRDHSFRDYFRKENIPEDMNAKLAERCRDTAREAYKNIVARKPWNQ
ncbi:mitochondrial ribosomal protein L27-domain-containing protein [Powellomyces hirtus]|nr:mitochondrial ribosomal protein L27-domain-containing protein [Powellomyces hirtus]